MRMTAAMRDASLHPSMNKGSCRFRLIFLGRFMIREAAGCNQSFHLGDSGAERLLDSQLLEESFRLIHQIQFLVGGVQ